MEREDVSREEKLMQLSEGLSNKNNPEKIRQIKEKFQN
jgi:hypothetical protein